MNISENKSNVSTDNEKRSFTEFLKLHKIMTDQSWEELPSMMDILIEKKKV
jgi:hypothetical protein